MADRHVSCIRTQKPGRSDFVVLFPARDEVRTAVFGSMDEIKSGMSRLFDEIYPGEQIEFSFADEPFDQLFS